MNLPPEQRPPKRILLMWHAASEQIREKNTELDKRSTADGKAATLKTLKAIGLLDFAAATMYVLKEKFGLEEEKLLTIPDRRRGEFLLKEIMTAGNFGKYDSRYAIIPKEQEFRHFANSMRRITRLIAQYPGETLWSPYFKVWHMLWRKRHAQ